MSDSGQHISSSRKRRHWHSVVRRQLQLEKLEHRFLLSGDYSNGLCATSPASADLADGEFVITPQVVIRSYVNGDDANVVPGPLLQYGSVATLHYAVNNPGNVLLRDIVVNDDNGTPSDPSDDFQPAFSGGDADDDRLLDMGETWVYDATKTVTAGQHTNTARVRGNPVDSAGSDLPGVPDATDTDPVNYLGAEIDCGDAPNTYATTLVVNGACHYLVGSLFLGNAIDAETDGLPTPLATGDDTTGFDDEDGLQILATVVDGGAFVTGSSYLVLASADGKFDAWIDFNGNGTFDQPAELLSDNISLPVSSGPNLVPFTIPASAIGGASFLRGRISSAGNLLPTGMAFDGEVEDYAVDILDGVGQAVAVEVTLPFPGKYEVFRIADDVALRVALEIGNRWSGVELFRAPLSSVASLTIEGTAGDDTLIVSFAGGNPIPVEGIAFNGRAQVSGDEIQLVEGVVAEVTYIPLDPDANAASGSFAVRMNDDLRSIAFTGLEPALVDLVSDTFVVDLSGLTRDQTVLLQDDGDDFNALSQVVFPAIGIEDVTFANPIKLLHVIGTEFVDDITIERLDTLDGNGSPLTSDVLIDAGSGSDKIYLRATTGTGEFTLDGGAANDTIEIGTTTGALENINTLVHVNGQEHESGPNGPQHPAPSDSCEGASATDRLYIGDTLLLHDQGTTTVGVDEVRKPISDGQEERVIVKFKNVETLELRGATGTAPNTFTVAGTASGVTVTVTGGVGDDVITVVGTGTDAHVNIQSGKGSDEITILATGGDGGDTNNAGGDTPDGSFVLVNSGSENDTIEVGVAGESLDRILGLLCVDGDQHQSGPNGPQHPAPSDSCEGASATDRLYIGDTLLLHDQGTTTVGVDEVRKPISDGQEERVIVKFKNVETIELTAATGTAPNTFTVAGTASGVTVTVTGGVGDDVITVVGTGTDAHVNIQSGKGSDEITILATGGDGGDTNNAGGDNPDGSFVLVNSGSENDTIEVGSPGGSLGAIAGALCLDGEFRDDGTELPVHEEIHLNCGDAKSSGQLFVGNTLLLYDDGATTDNTYVLTVSTFTRNDGTPINFENVQTIELRAAAAAAKNTITVTGTQADVTVKIMGGSGADDITVEETGEDAQVILNAGEGSDKITILATGDDGDDKNNAAGDNDVGSVVLADGGAGNDVLILVGNGVSSHVQLSGQEGSDTVNVNVVAASSVVAVSGGSENDSIVVGDSHDSLGGILGSLCINGDSHQSGGGALMHPATVLSCGVSPALGQLYVGDTLVLHDKGDTTNEMTYTLAPTTLTRSGGVKVSFATVETVSLEAANSVARNVIDVAGTATAVTVTITGGAGVDDISVKGTGDDSHVTINAGNGADVVRITSTGGDGSDANNADGDNNGGSFLQVNGNGQGDTITLLGNGVAGQVQLSGQEGPDTINVQSVAAGSFVAVSGGGDNDIINVGGPLATLDEIRGSICVSGDDNDRGVTQSVRRSDALLTQTPPYNCAAKYQGLNPEVQEVGDTLNFNDQLTTDGITYHLNPTSLLRENAAHVVISISYDKIEEIGVRSGSGNDQLIVDFPFYLLPSVLSPIVTFSADGNTETGPDQLTLLGSGADDSMIVGPTASNPRYPFEVLDVEFLYLVGGDGNDVIVNDTNPGVPSLGVPSLIDGGNGNDILVGGTNVDVIFGGAGIDAVLGNLGSDFLFADVEADGSIVIAGGELVYGNLGNGNDPPSLPAPGDASVALSSAASPQPDCAKELEEVYEEAAVKDAWTWLQAIFPDFTLGPNGQGILVSPQIEALRQRAFATLKALTGLETMPPVVAPAPSVSPASTAILNSPALPESTWCACEAVEADAASEPRYLHNGTNPLDVDSDGLVLPRDALLVINELNHVGSVRTMTDTSSGRYYYLDTSGDGHVLPRDALLVINYLNQRSQQIVQSLTAAEAEGEARQMLSVLDLGACDIGGTSETLIEPPLWRGTSTRQRTRRDGQTRLSISASKDIYHTAQLGDVPHASTIVALVLPQTHMQSILSAVLTVKYCNVSDTTDDPRISLSLETVIDEVAHEVSSALSFLDNSRLIP